MSSVDKVLPRVCLYDVINMGRGGGLPFLPLPFFLTDLDTYKRVELSAYAQIAS